MQCLKPQHGLFSIIVCCLLIYGCKTNNSADKATNKEDYLSSLVDTTVKPGFDFNKYSTGKWLQQNPIPADESSWGVFQVIPNEIYERLRKINEEAIQSNPEMGTNAQKIADFWMSGMDSLQIEKLGWHSLDSDFKKIDSISDVHKLFQIMGYLHYIDVPVFFDATIYQDEKISSKYLLHLSQGGLGLPDRDYYFDSDERTKKIREEYLKHIKNMFILMGENESNAIQNSKNIMELESALADKSRKLADLRDPYKNYHKFGVHVFQKNYSAIDWKSYFNESQILKIDTLVIGQPEFFSQLSKLINKTPVERWKIYLRWHLINRYANYLNESIVAEHFNFYGKILNGRERQKPRWKRVMQEQEALLGEALGQLYVSKYYSPATKTRHERLVEDIVSSYRDRVMNLEWMTDSTKEKTLHKLNSILKKVGYPDTWKDYSTYSVTRSSYLENIKQGNKWRSDFMIAKLYKPVDKKEWDMTPQTYNAYYNPSNNEIVLPAAAFIVPGISEDLVDDAILYAYAGGSTIGHELTHAFDDQGSQFDAEGNLRDWWSEEDKKQFKLRCNKIVNQFNSFVVLDSLKINGDATQGENIADLGGILVGLDAFKKTKQYQEGKSSGGFTPLQRYFFGWSISWLGHMRDEVIALRVKTDVHSPTFLRINGPVVNVPEWYEAFNINATDKMYVKDEDRVKIW